MKFILAKLLVEYRSFLEVFLHCFTKSCSYPVESIKENFFGGVCFFKKVDSRSATLLTVGFRNLFPQKVFGEVFL